MSVPSLKLPQGKLEKLADDLSKLDLARPESSGVPTFQRHGYLEKLGHTRMKWFKRFFVLRDSFLLSYNLQKSDYTVEPRAAIHMGNATIQTMEHAGKDFCFLVTTMQRDRFLFAAETEKERDDWVKDLDTARRVTHANMIKLAVENKCLAEEKGAVQVALDNSTSALALFSNEEYIQNTPITGGAEGWLRTTGFNPDEQKESGGMLGLKKKPPAQKLYFILRDSHLLMFQGGDMLTKPRGVMFLISTTLETNPEWDSEGEFQFRVRSPEYGDEIYLVASSDRVRKRWMDALRVGSRVTYPDFCLLLKEHELLAAVTMTPRAAPPSKPNQPQMEAAAPPLPMMFEAFDVQGEQLDAGAQQAYDEAGNPILRNPEGKLVDQEGQEYAPATPRYGAQGEQLDPFNRALPPGAVPMFTQHGTPIGIGPDGNHYLPDGTVIDRSAPHFDAEGNQLSQEVVTAGEAVAPNLNVALKVRGKLKGEGSKPEAVDVLGRTFRGGEGEGGKLINADGQEVPLGSARHLNSESGQLVSYNDAKAQEKEEGVLLIKVHDIEGNEKVLGKVEVRGVTTLRDVRQSLSADDFELEDFVFLFNDVPMLKYEEADKLAVKCNGEIFVRGKELKSVQSKNFTKKVAEMKQYEEEKQKEQDEFASVLAKVREGRFLRSTKLME